jgi:hypothetical protein
VSTRFSKPKRTSYAGLGLAAFGLSAVLAACGPDISVRTAVAPEASSLAERHTFRVTEDSMRTNPDRYGMHDPMISNSITSSKVHDLIVMAFEAKGYKYSPEHADFNVTYHATVAPIMDAYSYDLGTPGYGYYGYGYGWGPYGSGSWAGWGGCCADSFGHATASYDRGTVIIDAVDPGSGKLLWRGQGTSGGFGEPKRYMKDLQLAVHAIAKKFPTAVAPALTASR